MESHTRVNRSAPHRILPDGARLGSYEIVSQLGHGGMGIVYKARQPGLKRNVALKTMLAGEHASEEDVARFMREAQAAAQLNHPNIAIVYEVGSDQGLHFIAMELIEGRSLENLILGEQIDQRKALEIARSVALALDAAHTKGIIHRDIKPANILLDADNNPKVTDFGLAKVVNEKRLTKSRMVVGTVNYMSPEQAQGQEVDSRSDVFALGAVLYEMLTGVLPFEGQNEYSTMFKVINEEPKSPRRLNPYINRDVETICLKAMEKQVDRRYQTAKLFADDISRFLRGDSIRARPISVFERGWRRFRKNPLAYAGLTATAVAVAVGLPLILHSSAEAEKERGKASQLETEKSARDKARQFYDAALAVFENAENAFKINDHEEYKKLRGEVKTNLDQSLAAFELPEALHLHAKILMGEREYEKAIPEFNRVLEKNPDNVLAAVERGLCAVRMAFNTGTPESSMTDFEKLAPKLPRDKQLFVLGLQAYMERDFTKASELFEQAVGLNAHLADAYFFLGVSHGEIGNLEKAIDSYTTLLRYNPEDWRVLANRGNAYLKLGKPKEALADLSESIRRNKDPRFLHNRGKLYAQIDIDIGIDNDERVRLALSDFDEALRLDPELFDAFIERGNLRCNLGQRQEGIEDYSRAIEIKPSASAYFNRGNVHRQLREFDEAISDYEEAKRLNPKHSKVYANLGIAHLMNGDKPAAVKIWKEGLNLVAEADKEALRSLLRDYGSE